jgi:hypothetical protein
VVSHWRLHGRRVAQSLLLWGLEALLLRPEGLCQALLLWGLEALLLLWGQALMWVEHVPLWGQALR